jgi:glycosyltransferase involved in cell wall biosynthesis
MPLAGIVFGCYRGSRTATAAVAGMVTVHNLLATWQKQVTLFVALTEFCKQKFIEGGLPARQIVVKPNFVAADRGPGTGDGDYVLYVGRLSEEKGIAPLLRAWSNVASGRLVVVGDGPLSDRVTQASQYMRGLEYLGRQPLHNVYRLMGGARALVFPSIWYEGLPGVIIEAFSRGTPVIANRLGSMQHLVRHAETGWLLDPDDPHALTSTMSSVLSNPASALAMRPAVRSVFEAEYNAEKGYENLIGVYQLAIASQKESRDLAEVSADAVNRSKPLVMPVHFNGHSNAADL